MGTENPRHVRLITNNPHPRPASIKSKQVTSRSSNRRGSLSAVPKSYSTEVHSQENRKDTKKLKKKTRWFQIINPFRRKKRGKKKEKSFSKVSATTNHHTHYRKNRKRSKVSPSPSEASLSSCKDSNGHTHSDDSKSSLKASTETSSELSEDSDASNENTKSGGESVDFTENNRSIIKERCNREINKSNSSRESEKKSNNNRPLSRESAKSNSHDRVKASPREKKSDEETPHEGVAQQHKHRPTPPQHQRRSHNSTSTVSVKTHSRHASPIAAACEKVSLSNAENNCNFVTPPSSPGYVSPIQHSNNKEQHHENCIESKTNSLIEPASNNQRTGPEPDTPRQTNRHRRKRKQRYQRSPRNSLNSPPPYFLPTNQRDDGSSSGKAHYLVVEVVYHGRSLVAKEKALIQAQVADTVNELLKNSPTSPLSTLLPGKKAADCVGDGQALPTCKEYLNTRYRNIDKYIESRSTDAQQQRLFAKPNESKATNPITSMAKTGFAVPPRVSQPSQYLSNNFYPKPLEDPNTAYHSPSPLAKPFYRDNLYNKLGSNIQAGAAAQLGSSEVIDYVKYPDLRPAYVQARRSVSKDFGADMRKPSNSRPKNSQEGMFYDGRNDNSFMSLMNYMNKEAPAANRKPDLTPPKPYPPSRNPSQQKLRPLMSFDDRSPINAYFKPETFSSPAMMSLKNYASSVVTESPYSTPSGTPLTKFPYSAESATVCYEPHERNTVPDHSEKKPSPFNKAEQKMSCTMIPDRREGQNGPYSTHTPVHLAHSKSFLSSTNKKWGQIATPTEHEAWWMPREWARERRIGAYGKEWKFKQDDEVERQTALELSKKSNVEKIRTCNFIRF